MGRGNFCPSGELTDQWYIDNDVYEIEDEAEEYEYDYDLIQEDMQQIMDAIKQRFPSFYHIDQYGDGYWGIRYMLENKLFRVGTADNQWSEAVFIQMKDDLWPEQENLASRHFASYCEGIKEILLDMYGSIYLRTGPWTSGKLTKEAVIA